MKHRRNCISNLEGVAKQNEDNRKRKKRVATRLHVNSLNVYFYFLHFREQIVHIKNIFLFLSKNLST